MWSVRPGSVVVGRAGPHPCPGVARVVAQPLNSRRGRTGRPWRRARALCLRIGEQQHKPCCLCGGPIDYQFTKRWPRHRLAGTAHHLTPLNQGGHPYAQSNLEPAHLTCNASYGDGTRHVRTVRPDPTSRAW